MNAYLRAQEQLVQLPRIWLVTGVAGFIGSNLLEELLRLNQFVIGLDDYSTGSASNLANVRDAVGSACWSRFRQIEGDIRVHDTCRQACRGVHYILHQAALGSVPRSMENPLETHTTNVDGFLNLLIAARDAGIKRFVYASSSSVYGDSSELPATEERLGHCLSPYAVTKRADELYADVFSRAYGLEAIGLRYFNVFGPRQDPEGPYAAVIPKWIAAMIHGDPIHIYGDGETSRDFCYVANVVQANILAATTESKKALNQVYNIALGARTTLNQLFEFLRSGLLPWHPHLEHCRPAHGDFRPGDVRHSEAAISKAERLLGFEPSHTVPQGIAEALAWYRYYSNALPAAERRRKDRAA
jgi:UDP-N-acetylglucosamine 4-epimerase